MPAFCFSVFVESFPGMVAILSNFLDNKIKRYFISGEVNGRTLDFYPQESGLCLRNPLLPAVGKLLPGD